MSELSAHYKAMYSDSVRELAGSPDRSLLKDFVSKESKKGSAVFIDSIGPDVPDGDAVVTALANIKNRATYEREVEKTLAKRDAISTPHMEANKQRTLLTPKRNHWGHSFDRIEDLCEVTNPQARTIRQGMKRIWVKQDGVILDALSAATVLRGQDESGVSAVTFPAGQVLDDIACYGATPVYFSLDTCTAIKKLFEDQYYSGKIVCVVSPKVKKEFIDHSRNQVHSMDFVDGPSYFREGKLPDINGIHFIPHPLCGDEEFYAWGPDGVCYNQFDPFEENLGIAPTECFSAIAYMREFIDAKRIDDLLVVQGTILREAPAS